MTGLPKALTASDTLIPEADWAYLSSDVYRSGVKPRAVVQPQSVEELRGVVTAAAQAGLAIHIRGGGVSYTDAHLPRSDQSIVIDTRALNRIIEINETDMLVTVEPGISWEQLDTALAERGLKVPFVGTFSGLMASVGGTLSQNANGHGSNAHGVSAESVMALDILTPSGELIRTGTTGGKAGAERFRFYGPDLAGLFLGDSGALGVKVAITLRLLRRRPAHETASFSFPDFPSLHACMSRIASMKIEEKSFGLDQALSQGQIAKQDAGSMLDVAAGVWRSSPGALTGIRSLTRMALAGRRVLASAPYAAHYIVDGYSALEAKAKLDAIRNVALSHGREIANSVPTVVRSMPFQPLHNMLGPSGERWVPLHGLLPHSQVLKFHDVLTRYVQSKKDAMSANKVHIGAMFSSIGASTFLFEPALYWQDTLTEYHERMMDSAYLARLPRYPYNPSGAALVEEMRMHIIDVMQAHGAGHYQIGKLYPYAVGRDAGAMSLLRTVKKHLDPDNLINPGALI